MEGSVRGMKTYDQYVQHILKDIELRKSVDYGDKNSVRRYNAAADRIQRDVDTIEQLFPEKIDDFFQMIYHPDVHIATTIAWKVFGGKIFSNDQKLTALEQIKSRLHNGEIKGVDVITTELLLRIYDHQSDAE